MEKKYLFKDCQCRMGTHFAESKKNANNWNIFQESETGLYICLNRFLGVGHKYLERYSKRTDNVVFLHLQRKKKVSPPE